jgi:hypothetical protein
MNTTNAVSVNNGVNWNLLPIEKYLNHGFHLIYLIPPNRRSRYCISWLPGTRSTQPCLDCAPWEQRNLLSQTSPLRPQFFLSMGVELPW